MAEKKSEPSSSLDHAPLRLVFWDLFHNPEDVLAWSGIPAFTIKGLREVGQNVTVAGRPFPSLRKKLSGAIWHYYTRIRHLHYKEDRDGRIVRLFSALDRSRSRKAFEQCDVVLTTSTAATYLLETDKPIIVIHDATWGQILELYPYFAADRQVPSVVRDGFAMERATFCRPNVTLIFTSDWTAERAITDYNLDRRRVFVQPLGANFAVDPPREQVEAEIRARKGDVCRVLFVGKEFDRKGGDIAVAAVTQLRERGIPALLQVVGCRPEGLPDWVEVYGILHKDRPKEASQLYSLYAKADFFMLPTRAEAQGIVFNEAAAFGLPTAATKVGGVSAVVDPSWGCTLPLDAPAKSYADWVADVFADRERYLELAFQARNDFERRLSRSAYTARLLYIIRGALSGSDSFVQEDVSMEGMGKKVAN